MGKLMKMTKKIEEKSVAAAAALSRTTTTTTTTIVAAHAMGTTTTTNGSSVIVRGIGISMTKMRMMMMIMVICVSFGGGDVTANENNLHYTEHWFKTEELCPDLQEAVAGKDIDTANLPYKSVFRFMDHLQSVSEPYADLPCILEANGPKRLVSTALIEAIHVDTRPWNYTGAETCEEHIKLRLPEPTFLKRSNVPKIICRVPKSRSAGMKEVTGSLYHPYVWQFQKGKLGLSFSSFNLSHITDQQQQKIIRPSFPADLINQTVSSGGAADQDQENDSDHQQQQNNSSSSSSSYWLEPDIFGRQFVQIVFTTRFGGMCTVRVQQYLVDREKTLCGDIQTKSPFRLCGVYDCSEKENILRTLGFWTHRKVHDQLDMLLQTSGLPRWRREEASYLEILVSTLRALIMPLLFLSVFYVTRRLRLKLASRHQLHQNGNRDRHRGVLRQRQCYLRSLMRDGGSSNNNNNNNNNSSGSSDSSGSAEHMLRPSLILNHVVYDIPVGGHTGDYPIYEDLPPPYESIVQPPSYQVATTQVKQASSPCPVMMMMTTEEGMNNVSTPLLSTNPPPPPPPSSTTESEDYHGAANNNNNTTTPIIPSSPHQHTNHVPVVVSPSSQLSNNSGSRFSILDEDVVFQTPDSQPPSITTTLSERTLSPSPPPPTTTTTTQHPSV